MNRVLFSRKSNEWATPEAAYATLNEEFDFTDDPCPLGAADGLLRDWGRRVYVNPPYSDIDSFVRKAEVELAAGRSELVVLLLPSRTGTGWFHRLLESKREIRFLRGRLRFGGVQINAPFDSLVVVMRPESEEGK